MDDQIHKNAESVATELLSHLSENNSLCMQARVRAAFYPKFGNEKSDQEIRTRMMDLVSKGLVILEVTLKHSGSLFMCTGHAGGFYSKNSYGNRHTAVGVFVMRQLFHEAWGLQAAEKQTEFNEFLKRNDICVCMELVTAVLGDHGQHPLQDYVVVTAVSQLSSRQPQFYSTPRVIAFCQMWRLPTNDVWLFSTRESASSFFAIYDTLWEDGTTTMIREALDNVADIFIRGTQDHVKVQGEILEGLVARTVNNESMNEIKEVLDGVCHPPPVYDGLCQSLRETCAANMFDEKKQIKALLQRVGYSLPCYFPDWSPGNRVDGMLEKILQAHSVDFCSSKLQDMIHLMTTENFKKRDISFKFYFDFHKFDTFSSSSLHFKLVIQVCNDSVFQRYKQAARSKGLWPLYRGFHVDVHLFKQAAEEVAEIVDYHVDNTEEEIISSDDENLMIKLKFLPYKLRTFLMRNGLQTLLDADKGPNKDAQWHDAACEAYKEECLHQMNSWGTSAEKQRGLIKMLDEWAVHIQKCIVAQEKLSKDAYLKEAEPFLHQYAKRAPESMSFIRSAGYFVRLEDYLATSKDEKSGNDLEKVIMHILPPPVGTIRDGNVILFFPGLPGCAKSTLCDAIQCLPGGSVDNRPVHLVASDVVKGKGYWSKVAEICRKNSNILMLADKNAPNKAVWQEIKRIAGATAVPVIPDSEGTHLNPFSLDALAVFIFRVLQRVNHPGNLDGNSPNVGFVLLKFYHLYFGKSRMEFESELIRHFRTFIVMPLLKTNRMPLPEPVKSILEEGVDLYSTATERNPRSKISKESLALGWARWEEQMREIFICYADFIRSMQVPFDIVLERVLEQVQNLKNISNISFAAVVLPVVEVETFIHNLEETNTEVAGILENRKLMNRMHLTLAHINSHGVKNVAKYSSFLHQEVPVHFTAILYTTRLVALEAHVTSANGKNITSMNSWPHVTIWTDLGVPARESSKLPDLLSAGKASRIEINLHTSINGIVEIF